MRLVQNPGQVNVLVAQGQSIATAVKAISVSEQ
jgi:hypothetical protein